MGYQEECKEEEWRLLQRMQARYNRAPEKRQEPFDKHGRRLPMDIADHLESIRAGRICCEFGVKWNKRSGALP